MSVDVEKRYTADHEWVESLDGRTVRMGVTDYAQRSLGDLVFVELPKPGTAVDQKQMIGVVESVKGASDIYAPVSGTVRQVNEQVINKPSLINKRAEDDGTERAVAS